MVTKTLRLNDAEASVIESYASFHGMTFSEFARRSMLERIEDTNDLAALDRAIADDNGTRYSMDDIRREFNW